MALLANNTHDQSLLTPGDNKLIRNPDKSLLCKVTYILSKLFPASQPGGGLGSSNDQTWEQMNWLSILSRHAFRPYSEMLVEVTRSFAMSKMLTHYANKKTDGLRQPDENYAREMTSIVHDWIV